VNYLAHGYRFVAEPYFLAGTAVPDWLSVIDRRVRVRAPRVKERVAELAAMDDPRAHSVAAGIERHLHDDEWFHASPHFHQLNVHFTSALRAHLPGDDSFRPAFLGHILVEILLDAVLAERDPNLLDRYYASLAQIDPELVQATVNSIAREATTLLVPFFPRFLAERFLYDYADDARLLRRLNQVMQRVRLEPLPPSVVDLLPSLRHTLRTAGNALLQPATTDRDQS
jgi:hypothetical protein